MSDNEVRDRMRIVRVSLEIEQTRTNGNRAWPLINCKINRMCVSEVKAIIKQNKVDTRRF